MSWLDKFKIKAVIESPCVNDCTILFDSVTCKGCGRSPKQIKEWAEYTDEQKKEIINELRKNARRSN